MEKRCMCGSGSDYAACCEPFILGRVLPGKPVQLMRSRYVAFVMHNIDYLLDTWHPDCHARQWRDDIIRHFPDCQWKGLTIKNATADPNCPEQFVEFIATFYHSQTRRPGFIHERSRFVRLDERWYYIDGIQFLPRKNDACPCGSGKKYKKCCGR
ncbi:YchJ family protein [Martelella alba]|uniref:YchJ family protein n=1 Tax=Martelella alba TaxID=2590451 RepID=A0ABY2SQC0_9HYPH|nr:YchJ family protein [Martelella alba]TKI08160.1 YchJ family protein [Martelella alba]